MKDTVGSNHSPLDAKRRGRGVTPNRRAAIACALLVFCSTAQTWAQTESPNTSFIPTAEASTLVAFGRPIVIMRASFGTASARERTDAAARRIADAVANSDQSEVRTESTPTGTLILVADHAVFLVTPADIDTLAGETVQGVAANAVRQLETAISDHRESRSIRVLLRAIGLSVLATALLGFALYVLRRGQKTRFFATRALAAAPRVGIAAKVGAEQVHAILGSSVQIAWSMVGLVLIYLWLTFVLSLFPYTRALGATLGSYLFSLLHRFGLETAKALPGLVTVVVILLLTRVVTRIMALFFYAVETERVAVPVVHPDTAQASRRIIVTITWLFAIVIAYPYIPGSNTQVFKGISVFVGLMVSLGSSSMVNQAMSGLFLTYSRAYRKGEFLKIGDTEGKVLELGVLTTRIRTARGEFVTIPNSTVAAERTVNYTRLANSTDSLLTVTVRIGYDVPWRQVHRLLLDAAARVQGIRREPEPFVLQNELSDFYVEYDLVTHLEDGVDRGAARTSLHSNVLDQFNEHGVQIMTPHYEGQPAQPVVVAKEHWHGRDPGEKRAAPPA